MYSHNAIGLGAGDKGRFRDFLAPESPLTANRAIQIIRQGVGRLIDFPEMGTAMNDGTQRRELYIKFGKSAFVVRYILDYETDTIRILRVWHSRKIREQ